MKYWRIDVQFIYVKQDKMLLRSFFLISKTIHNVL